MIVMTMSPETAGAVAPHGFPYPEGRDVHFTLPVSVSTAKRPPRFDELPARIVVPVIVAGPQSLNPGFTVNVSLRPPPPPRRGGPRGGSAPPGAAAAPHPRPRGVRGAAPGAPAGGGRTGEAPDCA